MIVVGIVGRAFCGSTILSRMLNIIPGLVSVGEAYQILSHPSYIHCTTCGGNCDYLRPERFINTTEKTLYDDIGNVFNTNVLAVSDKLISRYEKFVQPHHDFYAIVLSKSAYAFAASDKRGHPDHTTYKGHKVFKPLTVKESLRLTTSAYTDAVSWNKPTKKIHIFLEDFVVYPSGQLRKICDAFAFNYPPKKLVDKVAHNLNTAECHNLMGNKKATKANSLQQDYRWMRELSDREKQIIRDCEPVHKALQR